MADTSTTDPASSVGDFDMMGALDWKDGIATLPGSDIRFRMTEFGTLEIVTEVETDAAQPSNETMATPTQDPSPSCSSTSPPETMATPTQDPSTSRSSIPPPETTATPTQDPSTSRSSTSPPETTATPTQDPSTSRSSTSPPETMATPTQDPSTSCSSTSPPETMATQTQSPSKSRSSIPPPETTATPTQDPSTSRSSTPPPETMATPTQDLSTSRSSTSPPETTATPTQDPSTSRSSTSPPETMATKTQDPSTSRSSIPLPETTATPTQDPSTSRSSTSPPETMATPTQDPSTSRSSIPPPETTATPTQSPSKSRSSTLPPETTATPTQDLSTSRSSTLPPETTATPTQDPSTSHSSIPPPETTATQSQKPSKSRSSTPLPETTNSDVPRPSEPQDVPAVVLAPGPMALEEAPSVEVLSCASCGMFLQGKFCSLGCVQPSSGRSTLGDQRERGRATPVPAVEGDRLGKRVRKKRKMYMDSGDDEDDNPEEEEEKLKVGKGRRAAKLARLVTAPPPKKKAWSWPAYLEEERAIAAPVKLFKEHQAVPQSRNTFKVGMKLEGLDPSHPSLFCVLSVAEIQGYRVRLHFDGYPECYDFWVNADSWDVKPAGWCEKTGHKLLLPKGCKDGEFNWSTYVKNCRGQIAPKHLFKSLNTSVTPSGFRVGMKLEAVDRKNPSLICVASIAAVVDNRLLIHFDNWDNTYDYWCDASSPYIHPIGFCEEAELTLTTPAEYKHPKSFSWERYLEETGAQAAPARAFKLRPPHGFQLGMKVEAVDKRNPMLIRVTTITDLEDHRVQIHFDGWGGEYDYWLDADSPDLHPVGWCQKTGHPLQNPQGSPDASTLLGQGCPTPGCNGVGHVRGPRYGTHYTAVSCPYSEINLNKEGLVPDRLSGERPSALAGPHRGRRPEQATPTATATPTPTPTPPDQPDANEDSPQSSAGRKSWSVEGERSDRSSTQSLSHCGEEPTEGAGEHSHNGTKPKKAGQIPKCLKLHLVKQETGEGAVSLQQALHESVFSPSCGSSPTQRIQLCWDKHCKLLPEVLGLTAKRVSRWSSDEVASFVRGLPGCKDHAVTFRNEQIDGEAFLLLTQADIVKILSIKLGPALKIYNSILMFKNADEE